MNEEGCKGKKNVLPRIGELRRREAKIKAAYKKKEKGIQDEVERIAESIKNGKASTGNPITDFLLVACESLDVPQSFDATLRTLKEQLVGKSGELFLVIRREKQSVFLGHSRPIAYAWPTPTLSYLKELYVIGILDGDELVFDLKGKEFGLSAKVSTEMSAADGEMSKLSRGPIMFEYLALVDFEREVQASHAVGQALKIVVGDSAVLGYPSCVGVAVAPRPHGWVTALYSAARRLGKRIPTASEEEAV